MSRIKSILAVCLCMCIMFSMITPVYASNSLGVQFSATLNESSIQISENDQTVVMTISADKGVSLESIGGKVKVETPLTIASIASGDSRFSLTGSVNKTTGDIAWGGDTNEDDEIIQYSNVTDLVVVTITVPANTAEGTYTVGIDDLVLTENYGDIWESGTSATTTLTITAPEEGGDDEGEGGGETTAPTFQMYYTLDKTAGTDAFKDVQLDTAADAKNPVTAEIFVVSNQNVTLQAYDIYLTYNSNLSYQSEAMDGKAYVNAAAHDVEATAGQTVSHIQMLDDEGTYALTANTPTSLGTITFDVSKSAEYGQDLYITLADGAINSTNVAVATTGSATGDKTSYWPTVTQEVNGTTYSGVEVMNTYTVSLNANTDKTVTGMPEGNQQTKEYNKPLALPTLVCPSNELAFKGWTTTVDPSFDAQVQYTPGASYTANAGATLYAVWKQNAYTITLNDNGGTYAAGYTAPSTYNFGEGANLPTAENISKEHYTFGGWYSNAECTGTPVAAISATESGNKEYWAKWIPVEYTITFVDDDGTTVLKAGTKYPYGTAAANIVKPADPTKTATAQYTYEFAGWSPAIADVTGDATYKATYTETPVNYTVTWKDGSTVYKTETVAFGAALPAAPENPTKTGYTFAGWDKAPATMPAENVVINATWNPVSYTITLDPNGGNVIVSGEDWTEGEGGKYTKSYTIEDAITLPTAELSGKNFGGWQPADATEGWSADTYTGTVAAGKYGNVTLTAVWSDKPLTVEVNTNKGDATITNKDGGGATANRGDEIVIALDPVDGYEYTPETITLSYVATDDSTKTVVANKQTDGTYTFTVPDDAAITEGAKITATVDFTAHSYSITYELNGGNNNTSNPASYTVENDTITLADPSKTGHDFKGWYTDASFTEASKVTEIVKGTTGDQTFYAKWEAASYNVTLNTNAGTINSGNVGSYTYGVGATLPTEVTKNGYDFGGWYTDKDCTDGNVATAIGTAETGEKVFYAKWTPHSYSITYNLNGGTNAGTNPTNYTIESETITLADPSKTGYNFSGWYTDASFTEASKVTEIAQGTTGDQAFYAKWEAVNYAITYMDGENVISGLTPATYTIEAAATLPTKDTVTKNGYTFEGWYTDPELTNKVTAIAAGSTDAKTFYAKWEAVEYTITFMDSDGTTELSEKKYTIESADTLGTASKAGYDFFQWEVKVAGGNWTVGTYTADKSVKGYFGDVTMIAQWNRTTMTVVEDYKFAASGYVMLRVEDTAAAGKVYTFAGEPMFYIENEYYNINGKGVYYTLIEAKYMGTNNELSAEGYALLQTTSGNKTDKTITYNGDINGDGTVNIADANIVYQMVEQASKGGYYTDLTPAQRLGADMSKAHQQNTDLARGSIDDVNEIIDIINGVPAT